MASSPLLAWVMGTQMQGGQPLSGPLLGGLGAGRGAVACIHLQVDSTHKGTAGPFLLGKREAGVQGWSKGHGVGRTVPEGHIPPKLRGPGCSHSTSGCQSETQLEGGEME